MKCTIYEKIYLCPQGAVTHKIVFLILILFTRSFVMEKNSDLTEIISYIVPEIFWFLKHANEYLMTSSTSTKRRKFRK